MNKKIITKNILKELSKVKTEESRNLQEIYQSFPLEGQYIVQDWYNQFRSRSIRNLGDYSAAELAIKLFRYFWYELGGTK